MLATSTVLIAFFSSFLLRPLRVVMKQTRQLVHTVKQSIYLYVYGTVPFIDICGFLLSLLLELRSSVS